jgi:hypothetical protein
MARRVVDRLSWSSAIGTREDLDMRTTTPRRTVTATLVAATAVVAAVTTALPAQAAAPSNGCVPGYEVLSVAALSALGYRVPAMVDSPSNTWGFGNQPGNGNGWVCGVPLGNQSYDGLQIYNFMDDTLLTW